MKALGVLLIMLATAFPALAQEADCTADVAVAAGPVVDVRYRCRSAAALAFEPVGRVEPVNGVVEARYRLDLADKARRIDNTREAVLRGEGVLAILSAWLAEPQGYDRAPVIDIRVATAPGLSFAAGLPKAGDAWRLAGTTARFAGYTALGRFASRDLEAGGGSVRLALLEGFAEPAALVDWVQRTAEAQANWWQGAPARQMLVGLVPTARRGVGYGRTVSGGGATVMVEVGSATDRRRLFDDWVLVHEMVHTGMPFVRGRATWFMEGAATYVEPVVRARAGWKTEEEVWREWIDDMPRGAAVFAAGLATAQGPQNYWGGAIFMLLADTGLRRATRGARGLEDALAGALRGGLDGTRRVTLEDYAAACDRATGTQVMSELLERHFTRAQPVDLAALWRELGIAKVDGRIVTDDRAPHAEWRKLIVPGTRPAQRVKLPWES